MKSRPEHIATVAVRTARQLLHLGCTVYHFAASPTTATCYIKAAINGRRFRVRIADHHGKRHYNGHHYYIRTDNAAASTRIPLHHFINQIGSTKT